MNIMKTMVYCLELNLLIQAINLLISPLTAKKVIVAGSRDIAAWHERGILDKYLFKI